MDEARRTMGMFPTIERFAEYYGVDLDDPKLKRWHERFLEDSLEINSERHYLQEEANTNGINRARQEIADKLRALGVDENTIAQATVPSAP